MIALRGVHAKAAPAVLAGVDADFASGIHAVVGGHLDGGPLLLDVLAGRRVAKKGSVEILGKVPSQVRREIAFVPLEPVFAAELRVDEALHLAARIRGDAPREAAGRLAVLGLEALTQRRGGSLAPEETRAVVLAEALSSTVVRVLLLEEPLLSMDPRAASGLRGALLAFCARGGCTLIATGAWQDGAFLSPTPHRIVRGHLAQLAFAERVSQGTRFRAQVSDGPALLAELAKGSWLRLEGEGNSIVAWGKDLQTSAEAFARAAVQANVELIELDTDFQETL